MAVTQYTKEYITKEGMFIIPRDWKLLLGEDVLEYRTPLVYRLRDLNIYKRSFLACCYQSASFCAWYSPKKQQTLVNRVTLQTRLPKARATNKQKYGYECMLNKPGVLEASRRTMKERYGSISPFIMPEIQASAAELRRQRLAADENGYKDTIRRRYDATMQERYNVTHALDNKSFAEKAREGVKNAFLKTPITATGITKLLKKADLTPVDDTLAVFGLPFEVICNKCNKRFTTSVAPGHTLSVFCSCSDSVK